MNNRVARLYSEEITVPKPNSGSVSLIQRCPGTKFAKLGLLLEGQFLIILLMLRMAPEVGRNKPTPAGVSGEASRLVREIRLPETPVNGLIPAYGA